MRAISLLGLLILMLIAWLLSDQKRIFPWRVVLGGLFLQFAFAFFILKTQVGYEIFKVSQDLIIRVLNFSDVGAEFLFGKGYAEHFFAFKVLPTILFVSCLSYVMFYLGVLQKVVQAMAFVMHKTMHVSGAESLVTAADVFLGQTESPLFVKPYLKTMTRSEINAMMTGGMATIAGGVMAAYASLGINLGHLLAASVMSAPAALLIAKIMVPETEESPTMGFVRVKVEATDVNIFDAAVNGAAQGLRLALNVGAMLLAFVSIMALLSFSVNWFLTKVGVGISFEQILGGAFSPLAFVMGVPWQDCLIVGELIAKKILLNEFVAYIDLAELIKNNALQERSVIVCTYALCGFANFSSIAIQIGGTGKLEKSRKNDFAKLGLRAMIGGCLATFMTACIAGVLY